MFREGFLDSFASTCLFNSYYPVEISTTISPFEWKCREWMSKLFEWLLQVFEQILLVGERMLVGFERICKFELIFLGVRTDDLLERITVSVRFAFHHIFCEGNAMLCF